MMGRCCWLSLQRSACVAVGRSESVGCVTSGGGNNKTQGPLQTPDHTQPAAPPAHTTHNLHTRTVPSTHSPPPRNVRRCRTHPSLSLLRVESFLLAVAPTQDLDTPLGLAQHQQQPARGGSNSASRAAAECRTTNALRPPPSSISTAWPTGAKTSTSTRSRLRVL